MVRRTILDTVEPFSSFARSVDGGVALSRLRRRRAANEAVVVARVRSLLNRMHARRFTDAAVDARRLINATSDVASDIETLAHIDSISVAIADGATPARNALLLLRDYAGDLTGRPALAGGPDLGELAGLSDAKINRMVHALSQLGSIDPDHVTRSLRTQVEVRIRAHHAHIVLNAARRRGSTFPAVTSNDVDLRQFALSLRDDVRSSARAAKTADPAWFVALTDAVAVYERDWVTNVGDPCVALLVAGTDSSAGLATRRTAALAYDAARLGLTWLAGSYELMLAWARDDTRALKEWVARGDLPLDSGLLDLPRAEVAAVAGGGVVSGTKVEVAGVVTAAASELQSGRVRTVIRLDDALTVYFPFSAVNGFGILPGVWCQARGSVLNESKGGYPPPAVRVRRRPLGDAARSGFNEYLEFQGRAFFDRMRAGNDATAGRLAHDPRTANEAADWN